jgi:hypothetical protein
VRQHHCRDENLGSSRAKRDRLNEAQPKGRGIAESIPAHPNDSIHRFHRFTQRISRRSPRIFWSVSFYQTSTPARRSSQSVGGINYQPVDEHHRRYKSTDFKDSHREHRATVLDSWGPPPWVPVSINHQQSAINQSALNHQLLPAEARRA